MPSTTWQSPSCRSRCAIYGVLLHRAGTVPGMIAIFFTPIVGTFLGVTIRDDILHPIAPVAMAVVIVGAMMTSRPER